MPNLEDKLNKIYKEENFKEKFKEKVKKEIKKFFVDGLTLSALSFAAASFNELVIAGMSFKEYIGTRSILFVTSPLTGGSYGLWRDYIYKKFSVKEESSFLRKYIADTITYITFQIPLHIGAMYLADVQQDHLFKALIMPFLLSGIFGGGYITRYALDKGRKLFKIYKEKT